MIHETNREPFHGETHPTATKKKNQQGQEKEEAGLRGAVDKQSSRNEDGFHQPPNNQAQATDLNDFGKRDFVCSPYRLILPKNTLNNAGNCKQRTTLTVLLPVAEVAHGTKPPIVLKIVPQFKQAPGFLSKARYWLAQLDLIEKTEQTAEHGRNEQFDRG